MNGNGKETLDALAAPFPLEEIQWKQQTNPKDDGYAVVVAYIDARTVAQRLNEVCGLDWSSSFSAAATGGQKAVECRIKVGAAVRADVGTESNQDPDKGGYSDAFKRAAVHFGIGAYLYRFPKVQAKCNGKYLTRESEADLLRLTQAIYSGANSLPRFANLKVWDYTPIPFAQSETPPPARQIPDYVIDFKAAAAELGYVGNELKKKMSDLGHEKVPADEEQRARLLSNLADAREPAF